MNIIFGDNIAELAREKYIVLELDTLVMSGPDQTATAYAIVEKIQLQEMSALDRFKDLHHNLMKEYRKRNWKFCEDAIGHLQGRWNSELDTFYSELHERVQSLKTQSLDDDWTGMIVKSVQVR
jgi:hypothetical protein